MKKILLSVLALVLICAAGGACWYALNTRSQNASSVAAAAAALNASSTATTTESSPPAGDLAYSNQQYHFSLTYPQDLQTQTYGGNGGSFTVAFSDPTTGYGFQVFVVPYDQSQITQARFKLDEPSGVMQDPTNVVIDGTNASMFYGSNSTMGDTLEVWFIHNGLLYEVTTYKQLDGWLSQIMQTWQFI